MRPEPSRWRPWQRVAFRFAFAYFLLYSPLLVVANLEGCSWLVGPWTGAWARVVPPIAAASS